VGLHLYNERRLRQFPGRYVIKLLLSSLASLLVPSRILFSNWARRIQAAIIPVGGGPQGREISELYGLRVLDLLYSSYLRQRYEVNGICMCAMLFSKRLGRLTRVNEGSHRFTLPLTRLSTWNEPSCLYSPAAEHHRTLAGTHFSVPHRVGDELAWVTDCIPEVVWRWLPKLLIINSCTSLTLKSLQSDKFCNYFAVPGRTECRCSALYSSSARENAINIHFYETWR